MPDWSFIITSGLLMIILGFILVFTGIMGSAFVNKPQGNRENETTVKGGGVVFIGPIPVVFGSDKLSAKILMLLAIVLMLLLIILNK
jgi:uncharacterized protein (TIGR00304 family)